MKNKHILILAALIALLIFVPYPPIVLRILYYIDFALSFVILEICIFCIFSKSYPKQIPMILPSMLVYFCIYSIALNISTVRLILIIQNKITDIPLISEYAKDGFLSFPYLGYIVFACLISLLIMMLYKIKNNKEEKLNESFAYIKSSVKIYILTFLVSLVGGTLIGIIKNDLSIKDSVVFYLGFSCSELSFYFMNMILVCIGVDALLSVIKSKTKFFSNL